MPYSRNCTALLLILLGCSLVAPSAAQLNPRPEACRVLVEESTTLILSCQRTTVVVTNAVDISLPSPVFSKLKSVVIEVWSNSGPTLDVLLPGCGFVEDETGDGFFGLILERGVYTFEAVPAVVTTPGRWVQIGGPLLVADPAAPPCGV